MICECGNKKFNARQICRHDVEVDEAGNFVTDCGIYDCDDPFGPYECISCGREYDKL